MDAEEICRNYGLNGSLGKAIHKLEKKMEKMGLLPDHIDTAIREALEMETFQKYGGAKAIRKIRLIGRDIFVEGDNTDYLISVHEIDPASVRRKYGEI